MSACGAVRLSRRSSVILRALVLLAVVMVAVPAVASAEQASAPGSAAAARLDAGGMHNCAVVGGGGLRCWGFSGDGQLGYGSTEAVGDNEAPGSMPPVELGAGRTTTAITAGGFHTCAVLDNAAVRCWGSGFGGQLGRPHNLTDVGDNETPGSVPPVDLGAGRATTGISAGEGHTCAVLDGGDVRCWGHGGHGRLGYAGTSSIGDDESPASAGPVDLGIGRVAIAISSGRAHTCALLDGGDVRCWGFGFNGALGHGGGDSNAVLPPGTLPPGPRPPNIGDDETPAQSGPPIAFGGGRTALAISAGGDHTCALLDDRSVRCWGLNERGQLGYGNKLNVAEPDKVGGVDLGGQSARAISAGDAHTCALLESGQVRCWGSGDSGQLGYGDLEAIGDDETPGSVAPLNLGRSAVAISLGGRHTCARLDDGNVRCWGYAGNGRVGYCSAEDIGDDETPGSAGPLALTSPGGGGCRAPLSPSPPPAPAPAPGGGGGSAVARSDGIQAQAARLRGLRSCRARAGRHARSEIRRARRLSGSARARARRHIRSHRGRLRRACLRRHGRTPGRVSGLTARAVSGSRVLLSFEAAGTHGRRPPAARSYVVRQSRRPIRSTRAFRRAQSLCGGTCQFRSITRVGGKLTLTVTDLRPGATYYYAVAARDNVSRRVGPRSQTVRVRTPG